MRTLFKRSVFIVVAMTVCVLYPSINMHRSMSRPQKLSRFPEFRGTTPRSLAFGAAPHRRLTNSSGVQLHFSNMMSLPTGMTSMWWETGKGKQISYRTCRIMMGAAKSALVHGKKGEKVYVFSNTLPKTFFCTDSRLRGEERAQTLNFTCRGVVVVRYNIVELTEGIPNQHAIIRVHNDIVGPEGRKDPKGYMHLISDIMRFLIIYRYGGTYVDIDQIFIHSLGSQQRLIARDQDWNGEKCATDLVWQRDPKNSCAMRDAVGEAGIPGRCATPPLPSSQTFVLFSAVLANFPPRDPLMAKTLELIPVMYKRHCWNCLGPLLLSAAFKLLCVSSPGEPPGHAVESDALLLRGPAIEKEDFFAENLLYLHGPILEVDFHLQTSSQSLVGGLLKQALLYPLVFAPPEKPKAYERLAAILHPERFKKNTQPRINVEINDFEKLPWTQQPASKLPGNDDKVLFVATGTASIYKNSPVRMCLVAMGASSQVQKKMKLSMIPCNETRSHGKASFWRIKKTDIPGWRWSRVQNVYSGDCLSVSKGVDAQLSPCDGHGEELLLALSTYSDGTEIISRREGHCLTVDKYFGTVVFGHNKKCIRWKRQLDYILKPPKKFIPSLRRHDKCSLVTNFPPLMMLSEATSYVTHFLRFRSIDAVLVVTTPDSHAAGLEKTVSNVTILPVDNSDPSLFSLFNAIGAQPYRTRGDCILFADHSQSTPEETILLTKDDIELAIEYWRGHRSMLVGFRGAFAKDMGQGRYKYITSPSPTLYNMLSFDLPVVMAKEFVLDFTEEGHSAYRYVVERNPLCAEISMNILASTLTKMATQKVTTVAATVLAEQLRAPESRNLRSSILSECLSTFSKWFPRGRLPFVNNYFSISL